MNKTVSVIIPVYNEEDVLANCLNTIVNQTYKPLEIIIVDDGSNDNTLNIAKNYQSPVSNFQLLKKKHKGPGPARNLGAKKAKGQILIFLDADMTFEKDFIKNLVSPILQGKAIGTFSKNEMVANKKNIWSICWNINQNLPLDRRLPIDYPDEAPVFRAILKKEFERVGGFDETGEYTDDWSLSKKLNVKSTAAKGALYYHINPSTLKEVWKQARWIGKNEFISGTLIRKTRSLLLYSFPASLLVGFFKSVINLNFNFLIFKLLYDSAIYFSVIKSFFGESKAK